MEANGTTTVVPRAPSNGDESRLLVRRYVTTRDGRARERLVELFLPLVHALARRYANRGERLEDLEQVGAIGLLEAIDRFDVARGDDLASYAIPTITGRIRHHLRDRAAVVRVPRAVAAAGLHPAPAVSLSTVDEISVDEAYEPTDDRLLLESGFRTLGERERRILHLRFYEGLSQEEIAREVGLSQVQVSRLIRASLERMRGALEIRAHASTNEV